MIYSLSLFLFFSFFLLITTTRHFPFLDSSQKLSLGLGHEESTRLQLTSHM